MNKRLLTFLLISSASSFLIACQQKNSENTAPPPATKSEQPVPAVKTNTANKIYGKVTDVIEAVGYTYVQVDTGKEKIWAAGPNAQFAKGSMIAFTTEMPMKNFHSKALNRDFSMIYFVNRFITDRPADNEQAGNEMPNPHAEIRKNQAAINVSGIKKAKNGFNIKEVYQQKQSLSGKQVRIRGKVTKVTARVLGKNWVHLKDGSTDKDLTLTTGGTAKVGDTILVDGRLSLNKDFGYGYTYDLIIEDAKVTVE